MKKLLGILAIVTVAALAQTTPTDQRTVLSTSTTNGVTTTLYVGRVQTDPNKDGSVALTVFPSRVITDSAGNVLSETLDTSAAFTVTMASGQYAALAAVITDAYATSQAASASSSTTTTSTGTN